MTERRLAALRALLALAFIAVFVEQAKTKGFPFDRERLFLWIGGALFISCIGRPWRRAGQLLLDWLPLTALLVAYDFSRGLADNFGAPIQRQAPINIEKFLFFGHLPTAYLQRWFLPTGNSISVWEEVVSLVYSSHFVVPFLTLGILWARSRREWRRYVNRFLMISAGGLITYVVLPVSPPWLSAQQGLLEPLTRPIGRGWLVDRLIE